MQFGELKIMYVFHVLISNAVLVQHGHMIMIIACVDDPIGWLWPSDALRIFMNFNPVVPFMLEITQVYILYVNIMVYALV